MAAENTPPIVLDPKIHVLILREPFMEYFTLVLDNGDSEELEIEETREWFKVRGANMDVVDKALDHCWNFYRSEVNINMPKMPPQPKVPHTPKI